MSDQAPRRPTNMPAGTTSLSDRIAALQRKNSTNGTSSTSSRSASVNVMGGSVDSSMSSGHLSPSNSPARSISSGSQAVKDRIARFQSHEKPLIPKSSFGAPTPMGSDRNPNALRPYPGASASGGGSGQWGEGVLRPQLTGGTWVGGGEGRGWAEAGGVRPQLTGGSWLGAGNTSSPGNSLRVKGTYSPSQPIPRSPTRQRDAFLDLDDDSGLAASPTKRDPMRRGSSFSDAQMAAASKGLARISRAPSTDGSEKGGSSIATENQGEESVALPTLPNAPTKDVGLLKVPGRRESSMESSDADPGVSRGSMMRTVPSLPSAPTQTPTAAIVSPPRNVKTSGDIEIGVAGASPAKIAQLQRTLSGSKPKDEEEVASSPVKASGSIPTSPPPFLGELLSSRRSNTAQSFASSDDGASDIGRLAIKSDVDEDDDGSSRPGSIIVSPIGREAEAPLIEKERLSEQVSAKMTPLQSVKESVTETAEGGVGSSGEPVNAPRKRIQHSKSDSTESGILDPDGPGHQQRRTNGSVDGAVSSQGEGNGSDGTLTASNSAATTVFASTKEEGGGGGGDGGAGQISEAQKRAKDAISIARNKSQRVKRPPVGRPMTVAEMDASDDDYEPGE